ncbi:hypothetical protein pb186bvf_010033 [Paramecium bursaria]
MLSKNDVWKQMKLNPSKIWSLIIVVFILLIIIVIQYQLNNVFSIKNNNQIYQ